MHFTDQLDRKIEIHFPPQRIISLVPSQTELLFDLGLESQIVGVTKFCVHPTQLRKTKQIIGGTKNVDIEKIKTLQPDLIIANKEENEKDQIQLLEKMFPVWISDVQNLESAFEMILKVGEITDREMQSKMIEQNIHFEWDNFNHQHKSILENKLNNTCIYLIWKDPFMAVGGDTFIHHQIVNAGFENIFKQEMRYPQISTEQLKTLNPKFIFLSTEPFPFNEIHKVEMQKIFPQSQVILVDGEMFSWYGSRMQWSFKYFASIYRQIIN